MKLFTFLLLGLTLSAAAQLPLDEQQFLARLSPGSVLPDKLLSSRTVVFYDYLFSAKELESIQKTFQRTGIDAVVYFESDLIHAGRDAAVRVAEFLNKREIANLILLKKTGNDFTIYITRYNNRADIVDNGQPAWVYSHRALDVLLQNVYRTAANSLRNENFLINEVPETSFSINAITGRRNEFFAIDLKVDPLAVPKFGDEQMDMKLEELFQLYPYKYKLTEPGLSETELRKQGFLYVLRFAHARNKIVRNALGYDIPRAQSAIVSMYFNGDDQKLKNIPVNDVVYKFYFKHIDSDNVFLGTKWDADPSWEQALLNQLKGYRQEFKIY